jgi:general secretion pathway protein D
MRARWSYFLLGAVTAPLLASCSGLGQLAGASNRPVGTPLFGGPSASSPSQRPADPSGPLLSYAAYMPANTVIEYGENGTARFSGDAGDPKLAAKAMTLSFVDVDVREFARVFFADLLGVPYVVDPSISGNVTVRSGGEVDGNVALAIARQALAITGHSVSVSDGVYRVVSSYSGGMGGGEVRSFTLNHIDGSAAQQALAPLLEGRAQILSTSGGVLSIKGDAESLSLVASMLEIIDVDRLKRASFGLFPLRNGDADDVATELGSLYAGLGVTTMNVLPIERMNALLVIADKPEHLDFAKSWVERLDRGAPNEQQVYIYQVKNREAEILAPLVADIFGSSGAAVQIDAEVNASQAVSGQGVKVTADPSTNTLVTRATPAEYDLIQQALRRLDTPQSQVYVETTIAEVRLSGELSHGVRWFMESGPFSMGITDSPTGSTGPSFPGFNFSFQVPHAQLVISALEAYTDVRIVSSPQLTVLDRETATIQVGDQVPIVTRTVQDAGDNSNVIANDVQFRDTGVILKVTPQIRPSGEVLIDVEQEVSRVIPTTSSQINSPTISQRKIASTVSVADGTAIVLGGLMSSTEEQGGGGLPGTQKTFLEAIFGSKKETSARSELIVIIRPVIIHDRGDMQAVIAEIADKMGQVMQVEY